MIHAIRLQSWDHVSFKGTYIIGHKVRQTNYFWFQFVYYALEY